MFSAPPPAHASGRRAAVRLPVERVYDLDLAHSNSIEGALAAIHIPPDQVRQAVFSLSEQLDINDAPLSGRYQANVLWDGRGGARLNGVTVRTGDDVVVVVVRRLADGDFRASMLARPQTRAAQIERTATPSRPIAVHGSIERVLFGMEPTAASPGARAKALEWLGYRLDLTRDVALGDSVTLLLDPATKDAPEHVLYAAVDHGGRRTQIYRCRSPAEEAIDGDGRPLTNGLLATPVGQTHVTSDFGLRLHPILGFWRLHRGVDFRAQDGAPVFAARDGQVQQEGWNGGYGRMITLRHGDRWETRYAHLSRWAPNLRIGDRVRQGEVIGYVGASGLATAPHLHFEVYHDGAAVNPLSASSAQSRPSEPDHLRDEQRCVRQLFPSLQF